MDDYKHHVEVRDELGPECFGMFRMGLRFLWRDLGHDGWLVQDKKTCNYIWTDIDIAIDEDTCRFAYIRLGYVVWGTHPRGSGHRWGPAPSPAKDGDHIKFSLVPGVVAYNVGT